MGVLINIIYEIVSNKTKSPENHHFLDLKLKNNV